MYKKIFAILLVTTMVVGDVFFVFANSDTTVNSALESSKEIQNKLKNADNLQDRLFGPALSDDKDFKTFDDKKEFSASIMCPSDKPVMTIYAFPSAGSELTLNIVYDFDNGVQGGGNVTRIAGMCGNGVVMNCNTGSWKNCEYCRWDVNDQNEVHLRCGHENNPDVPLDVRNMRGCFCFNNSCGAPMMNNIEQIINFAGQGIIEALRERETDVIVTKSSFDQNEMKMEFFGGSTVSCQGAEASGKVEQLENLANTYSFEQAVDDALAGDEHGPESPYESVQDVTENSDKELISCNLENRVTPIDYENEPMYFSPPGGCSGAVENIHLRPGYYTFELWGAQGGGVFDKPNRGGRGGYTKGNILFSVFGDPSLRDLSLYIGKKGVRGERGYYGSCFRKDDSCGRVLGTGGWNGGGQGSCGGGGGGATDIRSGGNGLWDRLIVAGGGGGSTLYNDGGDGGNDYGQGGNPANPQAPFCSADSTRIGNSISNGEVQCSLGGGQEKRSVTVKEQSVHTCSFPSFDEETDSYDIDLFVELTTMNFEKKEDCEDACKLEINEAMVEGICNFKTISSPGAAAGKFGKGGRYQIKERRHGGGGGGWHGGDGGVANPRRSVAGVGAGGSSYASGMEGSNAPKHHSGLVFHDIKMVRGSRAGNGMIHITPVEQYGIRCESFNKGIKGQVIHNDDPYDPALYDGCTEVHWGVDKCSTLAEQENCKLKDEFTDGIQTVKNGIQTGVKPQPSCRLVEYEFDTFYLCEPWWEKNRIYECDTEDFDYDIIKERSTHVAENIDFDSDSGSWTSQGDKQFIDGQWHTNVFDPNIEFETDFEQCHPSCLVGVSGKDGNIKVKDGEKPFVEDKNKTFMEQRECIKNDNDTYTCPTESGENIVSDCTCFDQDSFSQVASEMSIFREVPKDLICSSGEVLEDCGDPETVTNEDDQVMCVHGDYELTENEFGEMVPDDGEFANCSPKTWIKNNPLPAQEELHKVWTDSNYVCQAGIDPGYHTIKGKYDLGPLRPETNWFDPVVDWAKPLIIDHLKEDPDFIPNPGPECPCEGSSEKATSTPDGDGGTYECEWTVETSVDNINREDDLGLNPASENPFGDTFLFFSNTGSWGGTHIGACPEHHGSCTGEGSVCSINGKKYSSIDNCHSQCNLTGKCIENVEEYLCTQNNHTYNNLDDCANNCTFNQTGTCSAVKDIKWIRDKYKLSRKREDFFNYCTTSHIISTASCPSGYYYTGTKRRALIDSPTPVDDFTLDYVKKGTKYEASVWNFVPEHCVIGGPFKWIEEIKCEKTQYKCSTNGKLYSNSSTCNNKCNVTASVKTYSTKSKCKSNCTGSCAQEDVIDKNTITTVKDTINGQIECYAGLLSCHAKEPEGGLTVDTANCPSGTQLIDSTTYKRVPTICKHTYNPYGCVKDWSHFISLQEKTCAKKETKWVCNHANNAECVAKNKKYTCSSTENKYNTLSQCQDFCVTTGQCYEGATCLTEGGKEIKYDNMENCTNYCRINTCSLSGEEYLLGKDECEEECKDEINCNAQTDEYKFRATIKNHNYNDFNKLLELIEPQTKHIEEEPYGHEDSILNQCVQRYTNNHIDFEDTHIQAHFTFAPIDYWIYAYAHSEKQQPGQVKNDLYELPDYPLVYIPRFNDSNDQEEDED